MSLTPPSQPVNLSAGHSCCLLPSVLPFLLVSSAFCLCPSLLTCPPQLTSHFGASVHFTFLLPWLPHPACGQWPQFPYFLVGLQFPASTARSEPWFQCHQPRSPSTWEKYIGRFFNLTDKTANYLKNAQGSLESWLSSWGVGIYWFEKAYSVLWF